ncbi:UDP-N-acetylglucosamine 2-epimerase [Salinispirillum marinum]|uniref:UDP-N-acetylglucosamine 2-epimerase n=2 Tax=Saccharospirillaceae TaxID=255527 RepID=A0ABV8BHS8_9GAMM
MTAQKTIAVFTGTRAEYGLLYWLLHDLNQDTDTHLQLIVSGTHLVPGFGNTVADIERDGFQISARVDMVLASNSSVGVVKSMAVGMMGYAEALDRLQPDALVLLGDRFEALAMAQTALIMGVPIVHLHGGEVTEGAYDDAIRHSITKMASLHCVAAEPYRQRVIQLGEDPAQVHTVGTVGLEHLKRTPLLARNDLSADLGFDLTRDYCLVTLHSETHALAQTRRELDALIEALADYPDINVLWTYPNADQGAQVIIDTILTLQQELPERYKVVVNLGSQRYLSAMAGARAVLGNSSSGLIEAPALGKPTLNIGGRQQGRLLADSVVGADADNMKAALKQVFSAEFAQQCQTVTNPYGDGEVSKRIIHLLKTTSLTSRKAFHDLIQ